MYSVEVTSRARRELGKFDRPLKEKVIQESRKISETPNMGKLLSTPFKSIRSHHFRFKGSEFRMAYQIEEKEEKIIVHLVAPRENFYARLRRALNR